MRVYGGVDGGGTKNGTPLLDMKPYITDFDFAEAHRIGWLEKKVKMVSETRSDERFR